jgi:hypothetical protein
MTASDLERGAGEAAERLSRNAVQLPYYWLFGAIHSCLKVEDVEHRMARCSRSVPPFIEGWANCFK